MKPIATLESRVVSSHKMWCKEKMNSIDELMHGLLDGTGCDLSIMLTLEIDGEDLYLTPVRSAWRDENSRCIIPEKKKARWWGIRSHHPNFCVVPSLGCSAENDAHDLEFIQWARNVVSFSVILFDTTVGVVILIRAGETKYVMPQIARAWVSSQKLLSRGSREIPQHRRFSNSLRLLTIIERQYQFDSVMHALCHFIVSPFGLGWDRIWLYSVTPDGTLECQSSHGEVQDRRRIQNVTFQNEFEVLQLEIAKALERPSMNLFHTFFCQDSPHIMIVEKGDQLDTRTDFGQVYSHPVLAPIDMAGYLMKDLEAHAVKNLPIDYITNQNVFQSQIEIKGQQFLLLLGLAAREVHSGYLAPSEVLTSVFLNALESHLVANTSLS